MNLKTAQEKFYNKERSAELRFVINDTVKYSAPKEKEIIGAVISIESTNPERTYLVEFSDGSDKIIHEKDLSLVND